MVNVTLERISTGGRRDRHRVLRDGHVLVESSRDPEHDTCRTLVALGVTGTLQTCRVGCPIPARASTLKKVPGTAWSKMGVAVLPSGAGNHSSVL